MFKIFAAVAAGALIVVGAATANDFTAQEARATALDFAAKLEEGFMEPAAGAAYAALLREKATAGAYDDFAERAAYAEQVTQDLLAVHFDGHLRLRVAGEPAPSRPGGQAGGARPEGFHGDASWIAPGVACMAWYEFPGTDETLSAARRFLRDYADAEAAIIDLRQHRGGGLAEIDVFSNAFFAEPTHLVTMRIRADKGAGMAQMFDALSSLKRRPTDNGVLVWEHISAPSGDGAWRDKPIYLLTSNYTASAAEHFTLALKRTGRAKVIGETTRGAGNFGRQEEIGQNFVAFIAVGQTVDPDTGKGWDAVGIAPTREAPAEDALDIALGEIASAR